MKIVNPFELAKKIADFSGKPIKAVQSIDNHVPLAMLVPFLFAPTWGAAAMIGGMVILTKAGERFAGGKKILMQGKDPHKNVETLVEGVFKIGDGKLSPEERLVGGAGVVAGLGVLGWLGLNTLKIAKAAKNPFMAAAMLGGAAIEGTKLLGTAAKVSWKLLRNPKTQPKL